jgi:hypothetical protein
MSWHFSRELVEEFSAASLVDGGLFAPLRSRDLPETYCWHDKTTESLSLFQFGMMSEHSTVDLGVELLKWYLGDFLVRTSVLREQCGDVRASQVRGPGYGGRCLELLGRFALPLFSVKIRLLSELTASPTLLGNLPASGMYADGSLWELTPLDLITGASDFGSTLPTPTARDWKDTFGMAPERKDGKTRLDRLPMLLFDRVRSAGTSTKTFSECMGAQIVKVKGLVEVMITGRDYCPELPEWVMGWPIGWTELKQLETARFQQWLLLHGKCYT